MKHFKKKITVLILLSSLILISSVQISYATPPPNNYVGQNTGEYVWTIDPRGNGINELINDYNNSIGNGQVTYGPWLEALLSSSLIDLLQGEIAIDVKSFSEGNYNGIAYTNLTCDAVFRLYGHELTATEQSNINIPILNATLDYFNQTIRLLNQSIGGFTDVKDGTLMMLTFFVSTNINWNNVVTEFIAARDTWLDSASRNNITITSLGDGFRIMIAPGFFNESINSFVLSMEYGSDGLLTSGTLKYGDNIVVSIIPGESSIPGFEIPIIIGTSAMAIVSVIYVIKKKKKLKL